MNRLRSAEVLEGPLPAHFCKSLRKLCCGRHGSGRFRNDAILALAPLATVAPVPDHTGEQSRVVADPTLDTVAIGALQPLSASDHKDPMAIITLTVRSGAAENSCHWGVDGRFRCARCQSRVDGRDRYEPQSISPAQVRYWHHVAARSCQTCASNTLQRRGHESNTLLRGRP